MLRPMQLFVSKVRGRAARLLGRSALRAVGWRAVGEPPRAKRYVLIAAPHTSNWDLPYTLACAMAFDVKVQWVGKHTLFEGPMGWFMKALGGVPVERHHRTNFVHQMAELFDEHEELALLVASEGTRSRVEHWKSGFYYIAKEAGVPIVLGFLDYAKKECGFGPEIQVTGDLSHDMDQIRAFYADKVGMYPERFGPIRLKTESS